MNMVGPKDIESDIAPCRATPTFEPLVEVGLVEGVEVRCESSAEARLEDRGIDRKIVGVVVDITSTVLRRPRFSDTRWARWRRRVRLMWLGSARGR